jgi:maltose-binding protein MalE
MSCAWNAWELALKGVMAGTTTPENAAKVAQQTADACVAKSTP